MRARSTLEQRADVRTFNTAPLWEPLDLAGHASAATTLYSDAPSADLFLRILDVYENGQVQNVTYGILRVTEPGLGDGIPVEVDLGPIGHRFAVGHRRPASGRQRCPPLLQPQPRERRADRGGHRDPRRPSGGRCRRHRRPACLPSPRSLKRAGSGRCTRVCQLDGSVAVPAVAG
ncbi:CocE/NonD family hydrolase C-terminal non-catalytic domain-containing protein [Streptomyces sp. NPDC003442]